MFEKIEHFYYCFTERLHSVINLGGKNIYCVPLKGFGTL